MTPAMPNSPRTRPIPAAAPLDNGAEILCFPERASALAVEEGVRATVAVVTTVIDPGGRLVVTVAVESAGREVDVELCFDVLPAVDVGPSAVVLNGFPE